LDEDVKILHSCDSCSYQSQYRQNLNRHKKTQHQLGGDHEVNVKSYVCDQCGKTYKTKYGLTLHIKSIHQRIFKFQCQICQKGFSQSANYKGHLASHDTVLKLKCDQCNARLQYRKNCLAIRNLSMSLQV